MRLQGKYAWMLAALLVTAAPQAQGQRHAVAVSEGRGGCPYCGSSGKCRPAEGEADIDPNTYCFGSKVCSYCDGSGHVRENGLTRLCPVCHGSKRCVRCGGTGLCEVCHGDPYGRVEEEPEEPAERVPNRVRASDFLDFIYLWSPWYMPVAFGVGAVLSYGIFGGLALSERETSSPVFPSAEARLGFSVLYGENLSLRANIGGRGGLVLYGGAGTYLPNLSDFGNYHLGAGFFLSPGEHNGISWTWEVGRSFSRYDQYAITTQIEYSHFFGLNRRHGLFVGAGFGGGYWETPWFDAPRDILWEARLGYSYRFYRQERYESSTYVLDKGLFVGVGGGAMYNLGELLVGYKCTPHFSVALEIAGQLTKWKWQPPGEQDLYPIESPLSLGFKGLYRFTDEKWSPVAGATLGASMAQARGSAYTGYMLFASPEAGVSMRFCRNHYLELTLGCMYRFPVGADPLEGAFQGQRFTPGAHLRYIRVVDFAAR